MHFEENNSPLVSIIIITYNSAKFVIETLESAKAQTYKNIELIVSDDCSSDETIDICKNWIELNTERFWRIELITSPINTGIAANCNRAFRASKGQWLKLIAGDDIILDNGISNLIEFQRKYPNASLIHGRVIYINSSGEIIRETPNHIKLLYPTFKEEFQSNKIQTPSMIISKAAFDSIGGFDENYKIEDIYIFLKLLNEGKEIYYIDELIAKYRIHSNNFSANNDIMLTNHLSILDIYKSNKGYYFNYFIFSKNVLLGKVENNTFFRSLTVLLKYNPITLLVFLDVFFYYILSKIIIKKYFIDNNS